MNWAWAICIARADAASAARLRLAPGVEAAETAGVLWLRGKASDESLAKTLRGIPATARYEWLPDQRLRPLEARIPSQRMPELRWQPISSWLRVELPTAALPASEPRPVPLRLVRSSEEYPPDLLLTRMNDWTQFALCAAEVRLKSLDFAVDAGGHTLIRGQPLPPLPGTRFVRHRGIAIPAGFAWQPAVSAEVLLRRLGVSDDDLVLWHADGAFTRLHQEQFMPATRDAARATRQALTSLK